MPILVWDPRTIRGSALSVLFPWKNVEGAFAIFAAYTMMVHCPLEETFWRGAVLNLGGRPTLEICRNAAFFYLLHGAVLAPTLGARGWLLALPAGLAGGGWSLVTMRSRSLWPALISHWVVDAAILGGIWFFFVRVPPAG
jgi:membrane protease YdiL (CAAX protease family)